MFQGAKCSACSLLGMECDSHRNSDALMPNVRQVTTWLANWPQPSLHTETFMTNLSSLIKSFQLSHQAWQKSDTGFRQTTTFRGRISLSLFALPNKCVCVCRYLVFPTDHVKKTFAQTQYPEFPICGRLSLVHNCLNFR